MREPPLPAYLTPETFAKLMHPLQGPLCGFARGMVGGMEQARDIVQDVLVDAWRSARRGTPPFSMSHEPGAMRRWLFHAVYWRAARLTRHDRLLAREPLETVDLSAATFTRDVPRFEDVGVMLL